MLTLAKPSGEGLTLLQPGLEGHTSIQPIPFDPLRLIPLVPVDPPLPPLPSLSLIHPVRAGGLELPVIALTTYARCPHQFWLQYIDAHPGLTNGTAHNGAAIGSLTHKALEQGLSTVDALQSDSPNLPSEHIQEALDLAEIFRRSPTYATVQHGTWEQPLQLTLQSLIFNGSADLVGDGFVLDIKTDRAMHPQEHRFQLWAYATAMQKPTAHIAYLRHNTLYTFTSTDLSQFFKLRLQMI